MSPTYITMAVVLAALKIETHSTSSKGCQHRCDAIMLASILRVDGEHYSIYIEEKSTLAAATLEFFAQREGLARQCAVTVHRPPSWCQLFADFRKFTALPGEHKA